MCTVSGRNVHWCWRYLCGRTNFLNILSIWANKNGDAHLWKKSAIMNLIRTKLYRIHGRIKINACVKYQKKIFIGVGDIHPDWQISDGQKHRRTDLLYIYTFITYSINIFPDTVHFSPCDTGILSDDMGEEREKQS